MTNKLITIVHGNAAYLGFAYNKKLDLIGDDWSYGGSFSSGRDTEKYGPSHPARLLHRAVMGVNLVKECTVRPYELSAEIPEGFEEDADERNRVYSEVSEIIKAIHFGGDDMQVSERDCRHKYRETSDDGAA